MTLRALITQTSQVQILSPLQTKSASQGPSLRSAGAAFRLSDCRLGQRPVKVSDRWGIDPEVPATGAPGDGTPGFAARRYMAHQVTRDRERVLYTRAGR